MKRWFKQHDALPLWLTTALAAALFAVLYWQYLTSPGTGTPPVSADYFFREQEAVQEVVRELSSSAPLVENKDIYQLDTNLYDIYLSVFPTEDEEGTLLDLSAFDLHESKDHSYNPVLNCNIQILPEGELPSPLLDLNQENATIRVRGNTSRANPYKNFKIHLDNNANDFFGQRVLNLNKDYFDISKVSTKLSTDLLAEMDDILGYRTYFMRLWIRDASLALEQQEFVYQGMYTELEQPNKTYLQARGLSENGSLYKARNFTFTLNDALRDVNDPLYSQEAFEQVLGIREGGGSHAKLLEMLDALNDPNRDFEEVFAAYFNEENYLTWLAFNVLLGHEDIINQNFLLYSPEDSQTWYFMNWDFDGGLRFGAYESERPESLRGIQKLLMVGLHRRYFQIPGSLEKLDTKMQELLNTHITRERVTGLAEAYKPVLDKTLREAPDLNILKYTPEQLFSYLDGLYDGILHNYDIFKASIQYPFSGFVAIPTRNQDGSVQFAWDSFYSPKLLPVTYTLQVYTDYNMENLVYEIGGLQQTRYMLEEGLPDGTYYVLISGTDSQGYRQISLEHVEGRDGNNNRYYEDGLLKFTLE